MQEAVAERTWSFGYLDVIDLTLNEVHVVVWRIDALVELEMSVIRVGDVVHDSGDFFSTEDPHAVNMLTED